MEENNSWPMKKPDRENTAKLLLVKIAENTLMATILYQQDGMPLMV